MKIIIGLGNPGEKYESTRHNVGFLVVDKIAEKNNLDWKKDKKINAEIAKNNEVVLIKPLTFMNRSGESVQKVISYYKLLPKKFGLFAKKNTDLSNVLIIIHDDLDIELGKYKSSINSGSGGHNGVESIIRYLKTKNIKRLRVGINTSQKNNIPGEKYVLQRFDKEELKIINRIIEKITNEEL